MYIINFLSLNLFLILFPNFLSFHCFFLFFFVFYFFNIFQVTKRSLRLYLELDNRKEIKYRGKVEENNIWKEIKKKFKLNKLILYVYTNSFYLFLFIMVKDMIFVLKSNTISFGF